MLKSAALFLIVATSWAEDPAGDPAENLQRIKDLIPPLSNPLKDRLPLLAWHSKGVPTGLTDGSVKEVWDAYIERGLMPLCIAANTPETAKDYLPIFKYLTRRKFPIVILPQGWVQRMFINREKPDLACPHSAPAKRDHDFPCPAYMMETPKLPAEAKKVETVCRIYRDAGVDIRMILIDYESAAYLRNRGDQEERVQEALAEAAKCPRCVKRFGAERLASPDEYRKVVDEARAHTVRVGLCDPARRVFPDLPIGNFYAWPVDREEPRREGHYSAYGWPGSGMNVAQPRCYVPAGWGGAGRSQERIDWNAFYYCLSSFSRAKKVLREDELLIPWLSLFHQGRYQPRIQKGVRLPSRESWREMVCHMMLRGTETFAMFTGGYFRGTFPDDFKYPEIAKAGEWIYDVVDVQIAFNEMLAFNDFIRRGKVLNLEITGDYSKLDETTATWSGVATEEKALIRTVSFKAEIVKEITVFEREVKLPFKRGGQFFWVLPDGKITPITD